MAQAHLHNTYRLKRRTPSVFARGLFPTSRQGGLAQRQNAQDSLGVEYAAAPRAAAGVLQGSPQAGVVRKGRIGGQIGPGRARGQDADRKSTRLNSSHLGISYA